MISKVTRSLDLNESQPEMERDGTASECFYDFWEMHSYHIAQSVKNACNAGDLGLSPGLGRSPGEGHGNPLQYSCMENPHGHRSPIYLPCSDGTRCYDLSFLNVEF